MEKFESLVKRGDVEYSLGNNEAALALYKEALVEKPDSPEVWIKVGDSEIWAQPIGKDSGIQIEKSYKDYAAAAELFERTYYDNGYKEILGGIMKQSTVLVGTILKCQNSKQAKYKIGEQVVACRILITWLSKFFSSKKFKFEPYQSEIFDFILQIIDLIVINIKDYYARVPGSDFSEDISGIKLVYKYELLPILLSLNCCESRKNDIVEENKKKIYLIRGELDNLKIQRKILSEENDTTELREQLKTLTAQLKDLRHFKDSDKKRNLRVKIDSLAHEIDTVEMKHQHELRHIAKKEKLLESQMTWLNDSLEERLSLFEK